jgi:hypothetical protein
MKTREEKRILEHQVDKNLPTDKALLSTAKRVVERQDEQSGLIELVIATIKGLKLQPPNITLQPPVINVPKQDAPIVNVDSAKLEFPKVQDVRVVNPAPEKDVQKVRLVDVYGDPANINPVVQVNGGGGGPSDWVRIKGTASVDVSVPTTITSDQKTVTVAGIPEKLVSVSTSCKKVQITPLPANTNVIWYGGSDVSGQAGVEAGIPLSNGIVATIDIDDASKIYIDPVVSGEGVAFTIYA